MVAYELMLVLRPDLEEEKMEALLERLQNIIREDGGEITNLDKWGKRRLAYEVKKFREGFYVLMNFKSSAAAAAELERIIKISDSIIRYLLIRDEREETKAKKEETGEAQAEE